MIETSVQEKFRRDDREAIAEMLGRAERMARKAETIYEPHTRDEIEPVVAELVKALRKIG